MHSSRYIHNHDEGWCHVNGIAQNNNLNIHFINIQTIYVSHIWIANVRYPDYIDCLVSKT